MTNQDTEGIQDEYKTLPLVRRYRNEEDHPTNLLRRAEQLNSDIENIREEFTESMERATNRAQNYLNNLTVHTGTINEPKDYRRSEEHLALALFNTYRWPNCANLSSRQKLAFIDYQVPLKNKRSDLDGKIDLLGVISSSIALIELKAFTGQDTPVKALLEALAYTAVIKHQSNFDKLRGELRDQGVDVGDSIKVVLMAPSTYWENNRWELGEKWKKELITFSKTFRPDIEFIFVKININKEDLHAGNKTDGGKVKPIFSGEPSFELAF
jgi:hypothetical protein